MKHIYLICSSHQRRKIAYVAYTDKRKAYKEVDRLNKEYKQLIHFVSAIILR